jgi:hypothetical protein
MLQVDLEKERLVCFLSPCSDRSLRASIAGSRLTPSVDDGVLMRTPISYELCSIFYSRIEPRIEPNAILTCVYAQVLPLTQNVGVIEWVPDTIALGQYLTGHDTGAHARYKLGSLTPKECRAQMSG